MTITIAEPPPSITLSVIAAALDRKVSEVVEIMQRYRVPILRQDGKRVVALAEVRSLIGFLRKRTGLQPLVEP